MRGLTGLVFVCAAAALLIVPASSSAWSNGGFSADPTHPDYGIHDWIADKALSFQTADVQFLISTYHAKYLIGTEAPDNGAYFGDSFNHHVYYTSSGSVQSDVSATRARSMYQAALASLRSSDFESAAYYAGAMAHYISDLGVFGHTMGSSTVWGTSPHHGEYEDEVQSMWRTLVAPSPATLAGMDPYNSTLALARETTFGSGAIRANTWMEAHYDWGNSVFRASCFESINESVRAVARALGQLLSEAGFSPVPEFGCFEAILLTAAAIPIAACWRIGCRRSR